MIDRNGIIEGRIVHYVLNETDRQRINDSRQAVKKPEMSDEITGFQKNIGNPVQAGSHVAMIMAGVFLNEFGPGEHGVNGQCFLDGYDQYWVTSAKHDEAGSPGTWHWIERV